MKKFGSIGMGNMGGAIVNGSVSCNLFAPSDIGVYDTYAPKVEECEATGYTVFSNEVECYENTEVLLLAIKPQGFLDLMDKLKLSQGGGKNQIIVTIAAGISISYLQKHLGADKKIIRVMPNTPLLIGAGASAIAKSENVSDIEFKRVIDIFGGLGLVEVIKEEQMEGVIPANGSSPAFVYYFIKCLADTCEKMGVEREQAIRLLCHSFIGSAKMVLETGDSLEQLIQNVCSPGGATLEAIKVFDQLNLGQVIEKGCTNCVNRGKELGK